MSRAAVRTVVDAGLCLLTLQVTGGRAYGKAMPWLIVVPVAVFLFDLVVVAVAWIAAERRRAALSEPAEDASRSARLHRYH